MQRFMAFPVIAAHPIISEAWEGFVLCTQYEYNCKWSVTLTGCNCWIWIGFISLLLTFVFPCSITNLSLDIIVMNSASCLNSYFFLQSSLLLTHSTVICILAAWLLSSKCGKTSFSPLRGCACPCSTLLLSLFCVKSWIPPSLHAVKCPDMI